MPVARRSAPVLSEADFQQRVLDLAALKGWRVYHHPDSRHATTGGLPDLILLHMASGRIVFAELKKAGGRVRPKQHEFLAAAARDPRNEVALWRPADWDQVVAVLQGKPLPTADPKD
jgi:hypothetical protein